LQVLVLRDGVDARAVLDSLRDAGLLVSLAGGQALRFTPPLIVQKGEIDEALSIVDLVLGKLG
jgi:acetylornithine/succinyldiaminopimelate/putrescine aminotransferase